MEITRHVLLIIAALTATASCGAPEPTASDTDAARARSGDRNLNGANLTGANLTDADLTGVHCDATTRWPAGFTPPTCAP